MLRDILRRKDWLQVLLFLLIVFYLTGCITPTVKVATGAKPEIYRKVYLTKAKDDTREVGQRVKTRLEQIGFRVMDASLDLQGTGFLISPAGQVLTCAHVVGAQTNATVWIAGQRYICRVLLTDTNVDLAVLQIDGTHPPFVSLQFDSETNYNMGQDVFCIGFPLAEILGISPRLNKGLLNATVGLNDDPNFVQFSAPVQPGNSGGPLLNSKGEVMGVISSTLNPMKVLTQSGGNLPQNVNFSIKVDLIRRFLATAKITPDSGVGETAGKTFDEAGKSLGLIRAGIVTEEELNQPTAVCVYNYISLWDMWFRFRAIEIRFYDSKKGELILKVGQYQDDPFSNENAELNGLFGTISDYFFPGQSNPFKNKKVNSSPSHPAPSA